MQVIGNMLAVPRDIKGNVPTIAQDQITPPYLGYMLQSAAMFTLAAPTQESTITTLYRSIELVEGHGLVQDDYAILTDIVADRILYFQVRSVDALTSPGIDTVHIDRPIDHVFPVEAMGQGVLNNLNVDGSGTPKIYAVRAGRVPADVYGINISIVSAGAPDGSSFGDITGGLNFGLALRVVDSFHRTLPVFKTNDEIARWGSGPPAYAEKSGGGQWTTNVYIPIRTDWGVPIRLEGLAQLQMVVQDALQSLVGVYVTVVGQYTEGEEDITGVPALTVVPCPVDEWTPVAMGVLRGALHIQDDDNNYDLTHCLFVNKGGDAPTLAPDDPASPAFVLTQQSTPISSASKIDVYVWAHKSMSVAVTP